MNCPDDVHEMHCKVERHTDLFSFPQIKKHVLTIQTNTKKAFTNYLVHRQCTYHNLFGMGYEDQQIFTDSFRVGWLFLQLIKQNIINQLIFKGVTPCVRSSGILTIIT